MLAIMLAGNDARRPAMAKKKASSKQSKGGEARKNKLTPERRSEIAKKAADAKWAKNLPKATHEGAMLIGSNEIACAVLEGGRRVLTLSGFMVALGRSRQAKGRQYYKRGDVDLPTFLTAQNLKDFIPSDLEVTSKGVEFLAQNGQRAYGYSAEMLPKVCGVFLDAKAAGVLKANQMHIADRSLILIRALASTGIIALVDEATGYQYDRPRRDLEEYLQRFIADELRRWVKTFPADYFKELCRLRGVDLRPDMKLPQYFGHLTNNLVYRRIAPGLLSKLKEFREEEGKGKEKLHQGLSEDIGLRALLVHLGLVIGVMKSNDSYDEAVKQLDVIASVYPKEPSLFHDPADWEEPV